MTPRHLSLPRIDSFLTRVDPRWQLAAFALAILFTAALRTLLAASLALVLAFSLVAMARVPWRWYGRRLSALLPFLLAIVVALAFLIPDTGARPFYVSRPGIRLAASLSLKIPTIVSLSLVLLVSTPMPTLWHAARRLRVPALFVHVTLLTYRYLFVIGQELGRLRVAMRVRGYRNRASLHSYRTIGHLAGTVLVRGSERGERVHQAMRCRGFAGHFPSLAEFHTRPVDVATFALIAGSAAALLLGDFFSLSFV